MFDIAYDEDVLYHIRRDITAGCILCHLPFFIVFFILTL